MSRRSNGQRDHGFSSGGRGRGDGRKNGSRGYNSNISTLINPFQNLHLDGNLLYKELKEHVNKLFISPNFTNNSHDRVYITLSNNNLNYKDYLKNGFKFKSLDQIIQFIHICHSNCENNESPNDLILALSNNGCTLVSQILQAEKLYVNDAGNGMNSFQYVLLPLIMFIIKQKFVSCVHQKAVNTILGAFLLNKVNLIKSYIDCLLKCLKSGSLEDAKSPIALSLAKNGHRFHPIFLAQVFLPIIALLRILFAKYCSELTDPFMLETVGIFDKLNIAIHSSASKSASFIYGNDYIRKMVDEELKKLKNLVSLSAPCILETTDKEEVINFNETGNKCWPIRIEFVSTHDNDFENIADIAILPTIQEILSQHYNLPGNYQRVLNAHWLNFGQKRLIDTHFRLSREEFIGPLRNTIGLLIEYLAFNKNSLQVKSINRNILKPADGVQITNFSVLFGIKLVEYRIEKSGLSIRIQFDQPKFDNHKCLRDYWFKDSRLAIGNLVVIFVYSEVIEDMKLVYCTISKRDARDLNSSILVGTTSIIPVNASDYSIIHYIFSQKFQRVYLLEASNILLPAIRPILDSLKNSTAFELPFTQYICPSEIDYSEKILIDTPAYARHPEFFYDLSEITRNNIRCNLFPNSLQSRNDTIIFLRNNSDLDEGQGSALVAALSSELSCIQGPPGTGKTFLAEKLVVCFLKNFLRTFGRFNSPILIVAYTNHALDQFLQMISNLGVTSIARLGSKCSIKELEKYCLNLKGKKVGGSTGNKSTIYNLHCQREDLEEEIKQLQEQIKRNASLVVLRNFLLVNYPDILSGLDSHPDFLEFENGLAFIGEKNKEINNIIDFWLFENSYINDQLVNLHQIWKLSNDERWNLYNQWNNEIRKSLYNQLADICIEYQNVKDQFTSVYGDIDMITLKDIKIIGMTTTGAAKNRRLLSKLNIRVVIVEEAAEILESNILAFLSKNVQHMILIGDPQQLRPHISNFNLSMDSNEGTSYRLDLSLLERLWTPESNFPISLLNVQYRMRPELSKYPRQLLYPLLKDGAKVLNYPNIRGIKSNLIFFDHNNAEDGLKFDCLKNKFVDKNEPDSTSYSNKFEVNMSVNLLNYLLQQGYEAKDVVILTPYLGQLLKIRDALKSKYLVLVGERDEDDIATFENDKQLNNIEPQFNAPNISKVQMNDVIRVATIDNFQGEEAKIIIISLVRNYGNGHLQKVGFVKSINRTNVLLSRAKEGMYILGQAKLLYEKSDVWKSVLNTMDTDGNLLNCFPIYCSQHHNHIRDVSQPEQFQLFSPDGGCGLSCEFKLPLCSHVCPKKCHFDNKNHESIICYQDCQRLLPCNHPCTNKCGIKCCVDCNVVIGDLELPCGHILKNAKCYQKTKINEVKCMEFCNKIHPNCGHQVRLRCHEELSKFKCPIICNQNLSCGHNCNYSCGECNIKKVIKHIGACREKCRKEFQCGHQCHSNCHNSSKCPPCNSKCNSNVCDHIKCDHKCNTNCKACAEKCNWTCVHQGECFLPCGAPCVRLPCNLRCDKILACGHQCPSVCGEKCPSKLYCKECSTVQIKSTVVNMSETSYNDIDVDSNPIIVLKCGHFFTIEILDGVVELDKYYSKNHEDNEWDGIHPIPSDFSKIPQCPTCHKNIVNIFRYGRVTHKAVNDYSEKIFVCQQNKSSLCLFDLINELELNKNKLIDNNAYKLFLGTMRSGKNAFNMCPGLQQLKKEIILFEKISNQPPQKNVYDSFMVGVLHGHINLEDIDQNASNLHGKFLSSAKLFLGRYWLLELDFFKNIICSNFITKYGKNILKNINTKVAIYAHENFMIMNALNCFESARDISSASKSVSVNLESKLRLLETKRELCEHYSNSVNVNSYEARKLLMESSLVDAQNLLAELKMKNLISRIQKLLIPYFESEHVVYQVLTVEENKMIFRSMKLIFEGESDDNWYRCSNGHAYAIGENCQAKQTCPECREAIIIGSKHRLF